MGKKKDGKQEITGGSGKNIINPGESSFDYKDPSYLQQKLSEVGFKIYKIEINGKVKFEVKHIDNLENSNNQNLQNSKKSQIDQIEFTENSSDLTNSQRAEMAQNN